MSPVLRFRNPLLYCPRTHGFRAHRFIDSADSQTRCEHPAARTSRFLSVCRRNEVPFAAHSFPFVTIGDSIAFPIPSADAAGAEIYITKNGSSGKDHFLY